MKRGRLPPPSADIDLDVNVNSQCMCCFRQTFDEESLEDSDESREALERAKALAGNELEETIKSYGLAKDFRALTESAMGLEAEEQQDSGEDDTQFVPMSVESD